MTALIEAQPQLQVVDGKPVTTSLAIAQHFGKEHRNVLRACRESEATEEFAALNFEPASYRDSQNKERPMFRITRDGFVFVAMSFTGSKAARWKEAYIKAFNAMERQLASPLAPAVQEMAGEVGRLRNENAGLHAEVTELLRFKVQALESRLTKPKRRSSRPLTDAEIRRIHELAAEGLNHKQIAAKVNRSTSAVSFVRRGAKASEATK